MWKSLGIKDALEVNNQDPHFCSVLLVGKGMAAVVCSQCNHYHISALSIQVPQQYLPLLTHIRPGDRCLCHVILFLINQQFPNHLIFNLIIY